MAVATAVARRTVVTDGTFESGQGAWGGWGYTRLVLITTSHSGAQSLMGVGMSQCVAIDLYVDDVALTAMP
jgi:hypothetical protein